MFASSERRTLLEEQNGDRVFWRSLWLEKLDSSGKDPVGVTRTKAMPPPKPYFAERVSISRRD